MKVVVSACLTGKNCKYNGGNNYNKKLSGLLEGKEIVEICPEELAGLPTPRNSVEIRDGEVVDAAGNVYTDKFRQGVSRALAKLSELEVEMIILQSRSPSCGVKQIYDGTFSGTLKDGQGMFAKAAIEAGYKVVDLSDMV